MSFLSEHEVLAWAFGGIGITITGMIAKPFIKQLLNSKEAITSPQIKTQQTNSIPSNASSASNTSISRNGNTTSNSTGNKIENTISINLTPHNNTDNNTDEDTTQQNNENQINTKKNTTKILFIDDETKFKVVKILQNAGWIHTKLIKDAKSLDQAEIVESKIIFVDIQGVGVELDFKEEGLGLASALKQKYPTKKIIIYSAEQTGDRFHKALREVDDFLPKDADPYQFQNVVESFA